jgi:hypothetical protein
MVTEANQVEDWPRRDEEKRQRLEAALQLFVARYGLPLEAVRRLSDAIYRLYRQHDMHKSLAERDRLFDSRFRSEVRALAERTEKSPDADAREYAAHMTRLDTLERRNIGRGKAIDGASVTSWEDLSPPEKQRARELLRGNVLPRNNIRKPAPEVGYLREVATILEREIGRPISFSSAPPAIRRPNDREGRHHGPAFDVMMAAAEMADHGLTNEAMAMLIRRLRRKGHPQKSSKPFSPQDFP